MKVIRDATLTLLALVFLWTALPVRALEDSMPTQASLTNAATDETLGTAIAVGRCRETAAYLDWATSTSAGGVTFETSDDPAYTGTWAPYGVEIPFAGTAPKKDIVQITGAHAWIRARVSTAVVGGNVDANVMCN